MILSSEASPRGEAGVNPSHTSDARRMGPGPCRTTGEMGPSGGEMGPSEGEMGPSEGEMGPSEDRLSLLREMPGGRAAGAVERQG